MKVDLNCDLGEGFGIYQIGQDEQLLEHITSASIACGFHAGDPSVISSTITRCLEKGVRIGAHPGYPDLQGFGRRAMELSPKEVFDMVLYQVAALRGMTEAFGGSLQHVKPHGALYHAAEHNPAIAQAIAEAVCKVAPDTILFGLAHGTLVRTAKQCGLRVAQEVFADRSYQEDRSLTPRSQAGAMIEDTEMAIQQVLGMVREGKVTSLQGIKLPIQADTVCIHGDNPHALPFVQRLRQALVQEKVEVEAIGKWLS